MVTTEIVCVKGELVPVGQDQIPHLELSREIVRRFNRLYGDVFPEPRPKLAEHPMVPGIDGRKMSKSYNNSILLCDDPDTIWKKLRKTVTDPQKIYKGDAGNPDVCNIYYYQQLFNSELNCEMIKKECRSGALGCAADKKDLLERIKEKMKPIWDKRRSLGENPKMVHEMLEKGNERARKIVKETLLEVKRVMRVDY